MFRSFFTRLRTRLLLLVLVAIIPAFGLALYSDVGQRSKALSIAQDNAQDLALELLGSQKVAIETIRQTLLTLSLIPQVQQRDWAGMSAIFVKLLNQSSGLTTIIACDTNGDVMASAVPLAGSINLSDRAWFQRAIQTRNIVTGDYQVGRITHKPQINVGCPVSDDGGRVVAVLGTALDIEWLNKQLSQRKLPQGTICTLIDRSGRILGGYPFQDGIVGKSICELPVIRTVLSERQGVTQGVGPDGVDAIFGFAATSRDPEAIYVLVAIPREVAFAEADRDMMHDLGLLCAMVVLVLLATRFGGEKFIMRHVDALLAVTREVAGGNFGVRTGITCPSGELSQLALAFDQMTLALDQREAERKRAENQLIQTNERLENIFENSPDGIGIVDKRGMFVKWNKSAAEQYGYTVEELRGKAAFELYAEKEELERMLGALRRDGSVKKYEIRMKKKDGTTGDFELSISMLRDAEKRVVGSVCVARDLSDIRKTLKDLEASHEKLSREVISRTRAETALQNSRRELENIIDFLPDATFVIDKERKVIAWNKAMEEMTGIGAPDILGKGNYEYALPFYRERRPVLIDMALQPLEEIESKYPKIKRGDAAFSSEVPAPALREGDGVYFATACALRDSAGKIVGAIESIRDITAERKAEDELRTTNVEMAQMLASIPSFLIGLNPERLITRWNRAAKRIFGISADTVLGRRIEDCEIDWEWEKVNRAISLSQEKGATSRLNDLRFTKPNGSKGFVSVAISSVRGFTDGLSGMLLLGNDTTERKVLEGQLVQAQKLESIGQLAAGIAHEINTPAQYVGDNTRFLQEAFQDLEYVQRHYDQLLKAMKSSEPVDDHLNTIELAADKADLEYIRQEIPRAVGQSLDGIQRISTIVRAMKDFSHPGTDSKTDIDLNRAIESTVTVARNEWKYVADLIMDFDPNLPSVPCLPGELNQVILNMIINASHAIAEKLKSGSEEKGTITVSTRVNGEFAEIRIKDTGVGIGKEIKTKVFDPFFTTKEIGKGTGQGLAISRSVIVDKHGGKISFESEVGDGTMFVVSLPLVSSREKQ